MQALWMVLAALLFATMSVFIKLAAADFNIFEIVLARGLIGVAVMTSICRHQNIALRTPVPMMHVWRSVVGATALSCWFYAIAHLPLATAMTLNYMSGIWVAAFLVGGTLLLGRASDLSRQGPLMLTVLAGFAGVVLLLRPTLDQQQFLAGLVGLLSGMSAALAYIQLAALGRVGEPESRTVFYFSIGSATVGLVGMLLFGANDWLRPQALWLLPIGVLATLGQLALTRAYSRSSPLLVASLQYSGIVFAALYGLVLFGDSLSPSGWAGIGLILCSGVLATVLRHRTLPSAPAEEH
jgi:S-adenosylmethionine uptake transporter